MSGRASTRFFALTHPNRDWSGCHLSRKSSDECLCQFYLDGSVMAFMDKIFGGMERAIGNAIVRTKHTEFHGSLVVRFRVRNIPSSTYLAKSAIWGMERTILHGPPNFSSAL